MARGASTCWGLAAGASENQVVAKGLLEDLVRRGVRPDRRRLFVIDGSKAQRARLLARGSTASPTRLLEIQFSVLVKDFPTIARHSPSNSFYADRLPAVVLLWYSGCVESRASCLNLRLSEVKLGKRSVRDRSGCHKQVAA